MIIFAPSAPAAVIPPLEDVDFELTARAVQTVVGGDVTVQTTDESAILDTITPAIVDNEWDLDTDAIGATFSSSNEDVSIVDSSGVASRVADGWAVIIAKANGLRKGLRLNFSRETGQTIKQFNSWVAGTAEKHCTDNVESRIAGKTPSDTTLKIFTTEDDAGSNYVRSSTVWCADYQSALTGCNVWQSHWGDGKSRAMTAITPRHIVGAAHYGPPVKIGGTLRFVTVDGTAVNRTLTHTRKIPDTDIQLSILSSDLPETIIPISILPTNWADYFRNLQYGVPCLLRNQFGEARIYDLRSLVDMKTIFTPSMPNSRLDWYRQLIVGDSGGPAMLMVNGKLVLVTTWTGSSSGPAYQAVDWETEIGLLDTAAGVSTGHLPSRIDLTAFTNFNP